MAKIYRPIPIPAGVELKSAAGKITVKGKLGTLTLALPHGVAAAVEGKSASFTAEPGVERAILGTARAHVQNMIRGVAEGYEAVLEVRGMGYRVQKTKDGIQLNCGFSHVVDFTSPTGVTLDVVQAPNPDDVKVQMFVITIKGSDRQVVGEFAAKIRAIRPPDNYQGKGVRYRGERVRKKAGKRAAGAQA
jgi:large subunit ribosomal protein L6